MCIVLIRCREIYHLLDLEEYIEYLGGGGFQPHFSPRHTKIWIWGWTKMGKKCMEREGNKLSIFKIEKITIFSHDAPKLGFGDGKNVEKSIWKEREKVFVLTNCCTLLSLFSAF